MTTTITFRTDSELKSEVEDILEDIGMNMSTAFNCFLAKVRDVGGMPFALTRKSKHQRLIEAYNEAKQVAADSNAPTCTDPDKIMEFMLS
ncbi:MAG: type II toxin-antitoxin system RelB/DinJ family antitoxin [Kiritimatiellae bacterium]|nr:type II toxin-antitoxin system RelB/DinJ family antitoxin [Kiritimatiellia bacterium]